MITLLRFVFVLSAVRVGGDDDVMKSDRLDADDWIIFIIWIWFDMIEGFFVNFSLVFDEGMFGSEVTGDDVDEQEEESFEQLLVGFISSWEICVDDENPLLCSVTIWWSLLRIGWGLGDS